MDVGGFTRPNNGRSPSPMQASSACSKHSSGASVGCTPPPMMGVAKGFCQGTGAVESVGHQADADEVAVAELGDEVRQQRVAVVGLGSISLGPHEQQDDVEAGRLEA